MVKGAKDYESNSEEEDSDAKYKKSIKA